MKQILATVLSNSEILPDIHLLWAQAPEIASESMPGQFVMVRTGEDQEPLLRRPLAIHRVSPLASPTQFALLFSVVGRGTKWLAQRREGDDIDLLGPLGHGFKVQSHHLLLVAGGIGVAPLVSLAENELARGAHVTLILGAPTQDQLYPAHLLPPGIDLLVATEDGSAGEKGMATDFLANFTGKAEQVFACGPVAMYEVMSSQSLLKGKSVQVSMEARMGCGFGVCLGCAIETRQGMKLVCQDGPVFELKDIMLGGKKGGD
ncbi:MAG: dihydroorotate dehydrogenase electron transfer subunit [Dehalococcoidia bacterium]